MVSGDGVLIMNQGMFDAIVRRLDRIIELMEARPLSPGEQVAIKTAIQTLQQGEADGTELPQPVFVGPKTKRSRT